MDFLLHYNVQRIAWWHPSLKGCYHLETLLSCPDRDSLQSFIPKCISCRLHFIVFDTISRMWLVVGENPRFANSMMQHFNSSASALVNTGLHSCPVQHFPSCCRAKWNCNVGLGMLYFVDNFLTWDLFHEWHFPRIFDSIIFLVLVLIFLAFKRLNKTI